jgi:hypothetical protein
MHSLTVNGKVTLARLVNDAGNRGPGETLAPPP